MHLIAVVFVITLATAWLIASSHPALKYNKILLMMVMMIQSTLSKRTLSKPDSKFGPLPAEWHLYLCNGTLSKADTSLNRTAALVPRVSALERVDCNDDDDDDDDDAEMLMMMLVLVLLLAMVMMMMTTTTTMLVLVLILMATLAYHPTTPLTLSAVVGAQTRSTSSGVVILIEFLDENMKTRTRHDVAW